MKNTLTIMNPMQLAVCFSCFLVGSLSWSAEPVKNMGKNTVSAPTSRRVEVHLYGADMRVGAPLARWYHEIGITDVWLAYAKGAFPQDTANNGYAPDALPVETLAANGTLAAYRENQIRYWWFERPVPDFLYQISKRPDFPKSNLWDTSAETDAVWAGIGQKIAAIYPRVRQAGFSGLVYDTEAYYSYQGDEKGTLKPWIWGGHDAQYGRTGNYYKRGMQVGQAIHAAWPHAKVIIAYAFGYPGERWWYQGLKDGGVDLILGPEHSYGAGPGDFGREYFQTWWEGRTTKQTCDWKRTQFPFIRDNQHVNAGLFPIDFNAKKQNYRVQYFRQQLASAANDDPAGPIPVWLWPQGPFTPQSFQDVKYVTGDRAKDYFDALRDYSQAFPTTH